MRLERVSGLLLGVLLVLAVCVGPATLGQQGPAGQPLERFDRPFPDKWLHSIPRDANAETPRDTRPRSFAEALKAGGLALEVALWPGPEITAGEPVLARLRMTAPTRQDLMLSFIGSLAEAVHFEVTDALGRAVGRAYQPPPFRADGALAVFRMAGSDGYETILSHWYHFAQPGAYTVQAQLIVPPDFGQPGEAAVLSAEPVALTVLPRDPERLTARHDQLLSAQALPHRQAVEPAADSDYRPSEEACRRALLHVTDEAVLPHLALMVRSFENYADAVTAIAHVDSPHARGLLAWIAEKGHGRTQAQALVELERLAVAPEQPPQPTLPPPIAARDLLAKLCEREGLAVVAHPDAAGSETPVHADPAGATADLAAALEAAGLRAYHSAGGRALAVLGPPVQPEPEMLDDRLASGWRLLETITPEQLARKEQTGVHRGYLAHQHLTEEQIELVYELRYPPTQGPPPQYGPAREPVEKLFLAVWPLSGYDLIIAADWGAAVRRWRGGDQGPPLPPDLMPQPLGGSVLWWYWPYALAEDLAADQVTVGPVRASLRELGRLEPLSGFVEVSEQVPGGADEELLVCARSAPVRDLLWALEAATGVQAKARGEGEFPRWCFVPDRYPGDPERPDLLVRLPSLGCRSPYLTPAGSALLGGANATLARPPAFAYRLADLPAVLRASILETLPPPQFIGPDPDADYEKLAAQGCIVVLWVGGVHLEPAFHEPDGSGTCTEINLPAF